jgi:ABC-type multidrug transport system fused ATPase/permease subunit
LGSSGAVSETGKLVNLVSNDVFRFENFTIFGPFFLAAPGELFIILGILSWQLNVTSACAGIGVSLFFVPVQMYLAKVFSRVRTRTASRTDKRVRNINEVIEGITCVKSYAWEGPLYNLILNYRRHETESITQSQDIRSFNLALYFFVPPLAAFVMFSTYRGTGGTLSIPVVFSSLGLLLVLRASIGRHFTQAIETGSEAFASASRIESFLSNASTKSENKGNNKKNMNVNKEKGKRKKQDTTYTVVEEDDDIELVAVDIEIGMDITTVSEEVDTKTISKSNLETLCTVKGDYVYNCTVSVDVNANMSSSANASHANDSSREKRKLSKRDEDSDRCGDESSREDLGFQLRDVDVSVKRGELIMVVGKVGSGKSSLLSAILGHLHMVETSHSSKHNSIRDVHGSIAYVAQTPWIFAASIRQNVTIAGDGWNYRGNGNQLDWRLYAKAFEKCKLVQDMEVLPAYDITEIGERGISISGGQKARVSMARALYADRELYLLDDPLAAVDAQTSKALFFDAILPLRENHKATILVTHQMQYLPYSDRVIVMDNGKQIFNGTYSELQQRRNEFMDLDIPLLDMEKNNNNNNNNNKIMYQKEKNKFSEGELESLGANKQFDKTISEKFEKNNSKKIENDNIIIQDEDREIGKLNNNIWWEYFSRGGSINAILAVVLLILSQLLMLMTDYWLRWWAEEELGDQSKSIYFYGYGALAFACVVMGYSRARQFFYFTLRASTHLHNSCFHSVLHTPLTFFNANPTGRILNRFAKDINQIDELFPMVLYDCAQVCHLIVYHLIHTLIM